MENTNDQLVVEKKKHDGEDKSYMQEESKLWIPFQKISWAAIFSGALVTIISQMLFSLLGMGIGLSTIDPLREEDPMRGLGTGTVIWWSATMLVSLFLGGLATGKMYQTRSRTYLTWHGLLTWCTFTLFSFFMLTTSVGMLISGAGSVIETAVIASGSASKSSPLDISSITQSVNRLLMQPTDVTAKSGEENSSQTTSPNTRQATASNQNTTANAPSGGIGPGAKMSNNAYLADEVRYFFQEKNIQNPESKQALIKTLSSQTGMSETEATNTVDKWISSYEELKAEAKIKADQAAKAVSIASIVGFFSLLIGALVTIWGARVGPMREYATAYKTETAGVKTAR